MWRNAVSLRFKYLCKKKTLTTRGRLEEATLSCRTQEKHVLCDVKQMDEFCSFLSHLKSFFVMLVTLTSNELKTCQLSYLQMNICI